jgi:hypothetical protein
MEGVQNECTPSSSSEKEFVVSNENPFNEPSQHVSRERPQRQRRELPWDWWIATKELKHATATFLEEPQNIAKALTCENSKEWECTMQEEYDSLMANNTWTLVPLPVGKKPISCKWVFKIKQGMNGEVKHYKVRLWREVLPKPTEWIAIKLLCASQSSHLFVVFLHWRLWRTWRSIKWT